MDDYMEELNNIFIDAKNQIELNRIVGENHQKAIEQSIMNLAALKAINTDIDLKSLMGNQS